MFPFSSPSLSTRTSTCRGGRERGSCWCNIYDYFSYDLKTQATWLRTNNDTLPALERLWLEKVHRKKRTKRNSALSLFPFAHIESQENHPSNCGGHHACGTASFQPSEQDTNEMKERSHPEESTQRSNCSNKLTAPAGTVHAILQQSDFPLCPFLSSPLPAISPARAL